MLQPQNKTDTVDRDATSPLLTEPQQESQKSTRGTILIVDDEVFIRQAFQIYFDAIGFNVRVADGGSQARECIEDDAFDFEVVILDLLMPGIHGLELLKEFKQRRPGTEVVIATGCGSLSSAIEAMRHGAFDYITKPIVDFDGELLKVVEDALLKSRSRLRPNSDSKGFQGNSEFTIRNLSLFEKFVKLADLSSNWRFNDEDSANISLEKVQNLLSCELGISAGVLYSRLDSDRFEPEFSWGQMHAPSFRAELFSSTTLLDSVREAKVLVFPSEDLNPVLFGGDPTSLEENPMAIHLPLVLEGVHRGSLLLLFSKRAEELKNADLLDNGHPYLLLMPMLASVFLGTARCKKK